MKKFGLIVVVLGIVLVGESVAQGFSPGFRDAALDASDALGRLPMSVTNINGTDPAQEVELGPRKLDAEKALTAARRKAQTDTDKKLYQLLSADYQFRMVAIEDDRMFWNRDLPLATRKPYSDRFVAEYKSHIQCSLEIMVALNDNLERLKPEQLESGRKHLCLTMFDNLVKQIGEESKRVK